MEFTVELITLLRKREQFMHYGNFRWVMMENTDEMYSYLNRYGDVITYTRADNKFTFEGAKFKRVDALMEIIKYSTLYYNAPPAEQPVQLKFNL